MKQSIPCLVLLTLVLGLASCAPIRATSAISKAKKAQFKARLAKAHIINEGEKYITPAQYEYQLANFYLEKAKELQGFSKFEASEFYALEAVELSQSAIEHKQEEKRRKIRRRQIKAGKVFQKQR